MEPIEEPVVEPMEEPVVDPQVAMKISSKGVDFVRGGALDNLIGIQRSEVVGLGQPVVKQQIMLINADLRTWLEPGS